MKTRVKNCEQCRKMIHKEEQENYLRNQFAWLNDGMFTMACLATTAALTVQMQRGRSKEYVRKMFEDMVMIYTTSSVLGKKIDMLDAMKTLEEEYGIDFNRIHVNFGESEREFIKSSKRSRP